MKLNEYYEYYLMLHTHPKAMKFLAESDYWKKQFSALNLFNLVETYNIDEQQCQNAI